MLLFSNYATFLNYALWKNYKLVQKIQFLIKNPLVYKKETPQIPQWNSNKPIFVRIRHGPRHFVALPYERFWDRHGLQCDFRIQCTPDPGSVIPSELQMLLIELKLKTYDMNVSLTAQFKQFIVLRILAFQLLYCINPIWFLMKTIANSTLI